MEIAIETVNLVKRFGKFAAVENVSLRVQRGEIYGFLGLNGAGKTTTIRTILGMIRPTSGKVFLMGKQVRQDSKELWRQTGHLVETPGSYPDLTVRQNLDIIRKMRFIDDKNAVDKIMELLHLSQYAGRKVKHLSLGNSQRLGLAKALIHNPAILILDEPANGLGPAGIQEIREMLKDLSLNHSVTIFLSSHILDEISKFAHRIGIIHQGHLIREFETSQLDQLCHKHLDLNCFNNEAAMALLASEGYGALTKSSDRIEIFDTKAIEHPEKIAEILVQKSLPPTLLKVERESLEAYFLRTINENGAGI